MTEPSDQPDRHRGRAKLSASAEQELEQLAFSFAGPVVDLAQSLAPGLMNALRVLLRHAYLKGRSDMLTELEKSRRTGRPVRRRIAMAAAPAAGPSLGGGR